MYCKDELLLELWQNLRHYGDIVEDEDVVDYSGAWRKITYLYDGIKFFALVHNGELVSIH